MQFTRDQFIKERARFKEWQDGKTLPVTFNNTELFVGGEINEIAVRAAIEYCFNDITPRTMTRKDKVQLEFSEITQALSSYSPFVNRFKETENIRNRFREWHSDTCRKLETFLKKYYNPECVTFGKEQKVVNMVFKNLYCFCDADDHEDYFCSCDMPLDSYALEWCSRDIKAKGLKWKEHPWSNLDSEQYEQFQKNIRDKAEYYSLSPLQLEFIIWPRIQRELALEGLLGNYTSEIQSFSPQFTGRNMKTIPLEEKTKLLKGLLEKGLME